MSNSQISALIIGPTDNRSTPTFNISNQLCSCLCKSISDVSLDKMEFTSFCLQGCYLGGHGVPCPWDREGQTLFVGRQDRVVLAVNLRYDNSSQSLKEADRVGCERSHPKSREVQWSFRGTFWRSEAVAKTGPVQVGWSVRSFNSPLFPCFRFLFLWFHLADVFPSNIFFGKYIFKKTTSGFLRYFFWH